MVLYSAYNKGVKEKHTVQKEVHIMMNKKLENAVVTIVGTIAVGGIGWLFLAVAGGLTTLIN